MISFAIITPGEIALELAARLKACRLARNLTQEGLSKRAGVPLGTLKKLERTGAISLVSFIRLLVALKEEVALEGLLKERDFKSLDQVLAEPKTSKRGRIT
ncbi:MAG: helix-turn-helix domain-containing protein [Rhodospirillales bacterium]|nr:helix-turn-helix domain-containing protein [Rhodospirillales bacterium]